MPCECAEVLQWFTDLMAREMAANAYKGGRSGPEWRGSSDWLIRTSSYHVAKLGAALMRYERGDGEGDLAGPVLEHAADVGVGALIIADQVAHIYRPV